MSQNCNITNISPGVSKIEPTIGNNSINLSGLMVEETQKMLTDNPKVVCYYLSEFFSRYTITISQDVSLNYALFGAGAIGDEQSVISTYVSGTGDVNRDVNGKFINVRSDDKRIYNITKNIGYAGSNGALASGVLPCKKDNIITISNVNNNLQLTLQNQSVTVGNGTRTITNNISNGIGGKTTYSDNWSYNKIYTNGIDKTSSKTIVEYNVYNVNQLQTTKPNYIIMPDTEKKQSIYTTPFKISLSKHEVQFLPTGQVEPGTIFNVNTFYASGGPPGIFAEPSPTLLATNTTFPSDCTVKKTSLSNSNAASKQLAIIYYYLSNVEYTLNSNDSTLFIDTKTSEIQINLFDNFSDGYKCEINNIGQPLNFIKINSNKQNIVYNYNTTLIQSQTILLRNIKLIFNNSTWYCSTY